ncbi:hypothetical protein [Cryptosporangium sp. NPDC048952]|uniref:hypothetical protein n=1 Tax=Cryptosporangium sp. NPDC048952 TaxID=3363961 RepID=UPI0037223024
MERRSLREVVREHVDPVTEASPVTTLRRSLATLSILAGLFGVSATVSLMASDLPWSTLPGIVLLTIGGGLGVLVWWNVADISASRRAGLSAAVTTLAGALVFALAVTLS